MSRILLLAAALLSCNSMSAHAEMLKVGEPFPNWTLVDHNGVEVSSSELLGKSYLLWFFPKAMTAGCTAEGQGLRDRYRDFKHLQMYVLGVSFDAPEVNAQFVKREGLPFQLLSDRQRTLAVTVGAADDSSQASARRISYVVGPSGKVLAVYDQVDPAKHAEQVLHDLSALAPQ